MESIAVLGGGESGVGAALLAKKLGINVFVSDYGTIPEKYKTELLRNNIPFEEKGHSIEKLESTQLIVKSPGIPDTAGIITKLRLRHKEIISEIEFAFRHYKGKIIAITGSNGKTTTTSMVYHILSKSDMHVGLGGNIGYSFARLISDGTVYDWIVLELSSFQLENIKSFSAEIAAILNITADHLDRYDHTMYKYALAKWQLALSVIADGHLIVNGQDDWMDLMQVAFPTDSQILRMGLSNRDITKLDKVVYPVKVLNGLLVKGEHNAYNASVAQQICRFAGVNESTVEKGLDDFKPIDHRLELVEVINGIEIINDSKATNMDSAIVALEAMTGPVIWIAGGKDKGNDYKLMEDVVARKVKAIVCLTKDASKLKKSFESTVDSFSETEDVMICVERCMEIAQPGDSILLSPACASFDLFNNYEHRGNLFKQSIKNYILGQNK